jgi:hypothetical protein
MGAGEGDRGKISKLCRASVGYSMYQPTHCIMQFLMSSVGFRRSTYFAIDT